MTRPLSHRELGSVPALFDPESPPEWEDMVYSGETTIYGECIRVGGTSRPSAEIKLLSGQNLSIRLKNKALAESLGKRLYLQIGLTGQATWNFDSGQMVSFCADGITEFSDVSEDGKYSTLVDAFSMLEEASEGAWDNVDPEDFILQQRRD